MLLGKELFMAELAQGAFFLLEEWAQRWERLMIDTFGPNLEVMREMVRGDRSNLLCITTSCSGNFKEKAEKAGQFVELPLRWLDVSLDHLESVLQSAIDRKLQEQSLMESRT
jgi:hypothetical protein